MKVLQLRNPGIQLEEGEALKIVQALVGEGEALEERKPRLQELHLHGTGPFTFTVASALPEHLRASLEVLALEEVELVGSAFQPLQHVTSLRQLHLTQATCNSHEARDSLNLLTQVRVAIALCV